jgi:hypothetical protein
LLPGRHRFGSVPGTAGDRGSRRQGARDLAAATIAEWFHIKSDCDGTLAYSCMQQDSDEVQI